MLLGSEWRVVFNSVHGRMALSLISGGETFCFYERDYWEGKFGGARFGSMIFKSSQRRTICVSVFRIARYVEFVRYFGRKWTVSLKESRSIRGERRVNETQRSHAVFNAFSLVGRRETMLGLASCSLDFGVS